MKKSIIAIALITLITLVCSSSVIYFTEKAAKITSRTSTTRNTVIIDAGHGGIDVGTIGVDGAQEKSINLSIAINLYDYLMISGINSKLLRDGDYEFYKPGEERQKSDLYNRLEYINSIDNSNLISIHQNYYSGSEEEWGTQIWYSPNNSESKIIADNILNSVKTNLQPNNNRKNKISDNSYYLLYNAQVPSVMIECGFMSNVNENKKLQDKEYQRKFAYSILAGICEDL